MKVFSLLKYGSLKCCSAVCPVILHFCGEKGELPAGSPGNTLTWWWKTYGSSRSGRGFGPEWKRRLCMCQCCNKYQLGKLVAAFPQLKHYTAEPLIYHSWTSGCIAHAQFSILLGGFPVFMHRSNQGLIDLLLKLCHLCNDRWLFALFPFVCIGLFLVDLQQTTLVKNELVS